MNNDLKLSALAPLNLFAVSDLKKKYKNVVVVAGSDQMNSIKRGLKESVEFIAITEKNPDANETKMKSFATKALYEQFKKKKMRLSMISLKLLITLRTQQNLMQMQSVTFMSV